MQELSTNDAHIYPYILSVTTRVGDDDPKILEEITYRTIATWLGIVGYLEQGVYKYTKGSVEQEYADEINKRMMADTDAPKVEPFEFSEPFGQSRCTVWATFRGEKNAFHLSSDDNPQRAIDAWLANRNGIQRAVDKFVPKGTQDVPPSAQQQQSAQPPTNPPQSRVAPNPAVAGAICTKKDAIAKLPPGSPFKMKIVQIEKHSKDGADFYDFYEPYGGKAGQFAATSVFADNEIAVNNGLIAHLDSLGIKLGQALTGNWIVNCSVGKPKTKTVKGEEKTFINIYLNSFD